MHMWNQIARICLNLSIALILPATVLAQQSDQPAAKPDPNMQAHVGDLTGNAKPGADLYYRYCWGCHGARGNGEGENAPYLDPRPRNFVAVIFKCRSTPTGMLPLDSDLYNSLERGFNFTNMTLGYPDRRRSCELGGVRKDFLG